MWKKILLQNVFQLIVWAQVLKLKRITINVGEIFMHLTDAWAPTGIAFTTLLLKYNVSQKIYLVGSVAKNPKNLSAFKSRELIFIYFSILPLGGLRIKKWSNLREYFQFGSILKKMKKSLSLDLSISSKKLRDSNLVYSNEDRAELKISSEITPSLNP